MPLGHGSESSAADFHDRFNYANDIVHSDYRHIHRRALVAGRGAAVHHAAVSCRPHRRLFPTIGVPWMHEDGFAGEIEVAPPEHRFTVQGSESIMGF